MEVTATKPTARREGLSITVAGTETLVYDPEQFMIHRLGNVTATIWNLADGSRDVATLVSDARSELSRSISTRDVENALLELSNLNLIDGVPSAKRKLSRRLLVGGAFGAAAASTYIPVSAASLQTCIERVGEQTIADITASCAADGGTASWFSFEPCIYACTWPDGDQVIANSPGALHAHIAERHQRLSQPVENAVPDQEPFEVETIDTPFQEVPTEAPTESPVVETTVDTLAEPVPAETLPPAGPAQGETESAPVVDVAVPAPAPTEAPFVETQAAPAPVVVEDPLPVAPNVDTDIEVEVIIDN